MTIGKLTIYIFARQIFLAGLVMIFLLTPSPLKAAPGSNLMERWLVNDSLSSRTVDNSSWQKILDTYLVPQEGGSGTFNYAAVTDQDKELLRQYVTLLGRVDVDRLHQTEQMAFWINAYNALVISIILEDYPVRSINDIGGSFFSPGPWKEKRFRVYQINLSLNDIYHRILRPIWGDARVHYALSCGAISCPALIPTPFNGGTIEADLKKAQDAFINTGPAVRQIKAEDVVVSRIYDWYAEDFGSTEIEILNHIKANAKGNLAVRLTRVTEISSYGFDWDLNRAPE